MAENQQLTKIRSSLERHIGDKVRLKAKIGRKNFMVREGVIESIYPSIFIVKLHEKADMTDSRVSFSYTDVLTKAVEIQLYRKEA